MGKKCRKHPPAHRCAERRQGFGIRYLHDRYYNGWYLMQHEFDYEWYTNMYLPVTKIRYCPFCGEELEEVNEDG